MLDYLLESAPDHPSSDANQSGPARYVQVLVLTEVDYVLRNERRTMHAFILDIAKCVFTYAPPSPRQLARAVEIDRRHADLELGL